MVVPNGSTYVGVWDGDFDYGPSAGVGDTDDPNTSNTGIPPVVAALCGGRGREGRGAAAGRQHRRHASAQAPTSTTRSITPEGSRLRNANPSGNTEWEYFRLDTAPFNASTMDYHVDSLSGRCLSHPPARHGLAQSVLR